jgi:ubiquitin
MPPKNLFASKNKMKLPTEFYIYLVSAATGIIGTVIGIYIRISNKMTKLEEKVESLEKQTHEDRKERKELTKALHEISDSLSMLKGYLEGQSTFKQQPKPRRQSVN